MIDFIFDPYKSDKTNCPKLAALNIGRCLTRLSWHLSQGWLFAGATSNSTNFRAHEKNFAQAFDIFRHISHLAGQFKPESAGKIFNELDAIREWAENNAFPDNCYVSTLESIKNFHDYIDPQKVYAHEIYSEKIVKVQIDPILHELKTKIKNLTSDELVKWTPIVGQRIGFG